MKKQFIGLIVILALMLVMVLSVITYNQWPLMTGKKIILATQPIDPFDPFKGQYLNINYEISNINDVSGFKVGDMVYVSLKEDERGIWKKVAVSTSKPELGDFIKGKVKTGFGNNVRVEYGIEQFFFERHAELPMRNITVEAAVDSSGRAKIVQLLQNGKPIDIKYENFSIKS